MRARPPVAAESGGPSRTGEGWGAGHRVVRRHRARCRCGISGKVERGAVAAIDPSQAQQPAHSLASPTSFAQIAPTALACAPLCAGTEARLSGGCCSAGAAISGAVAQRGAGTELPSLRCAVHSADAMRIEGSDLPTVRRALRPRAPREALGPRRLPMSRDAGMVPALLAGAAAGWSGRRGVQLTTGSI